MNNYTPETITIQLTQGQVTVIDFKHKDLTDLKWFARKHHSGNFYATRNIPNGNGKQTAMQLSRVILSRKLGRPLERHELADHWNLDTLDNREENLRVASNAQNNRNSKRPKTNTTGYKGVSYKKKNRQFVAQISVNREKKHLGLFPTAELAYEAYCKAAVEHFGEFARLE